MYPRPGTINFLQTSCCFTLSNCDHWLRLKQSSRNRGTGETVTKKGLNWTNLHFFYPEGTGKSSIYCRVLHGLQNSFSQWINQFHAIFTGALYIRKHTLLILFHKEIGTQIEWLDKAIHCKWQYWATLKAASKLSFTHVFTFLNSFVQNTQRETTCSSPEGRPLSTTAVEMCVSVCLKICEHPASSPRKNSDTTEGFEQWVILSTLRGAMSTKRSVCSVSSL